MKELAEQELKLLEAQHPTRFQYLKLQLKEFIHLLDQGDQQHLHSSIVTQESSSSRKRQREDEGCSKHKHKRKRKTEIKRPRKEEGIRCDDAIHKAEVCLRKIQTLKSLFFSSNH